MNAVLSYALMAPAALLTRGPAQEPWNSFSSAEGRVKFEMPAPPQEQLLKAPDGTNCRIYASMQEDAIFEVVAMDLPEDLQLALKEVVSDSEVTLTRQILDDSILGFVEEAKAKVSANDYVLFQKLPARTCTVRLDGFREARLMSVVGKSHAYLFTISYSRAGNGPATAKRFFDSIVLRK